jgi:amidohydrolase
MSSLSPSIAKAVRCEKRRIVELGRFIHAHPELGFQEREAARRITGFLEAIGFEIQQPHAKLATAFRARLRGTGRGPVIGVCAEYDALPELGHACGHNLITVTAIAAAAGIAGTRGRWRGQFEIIGTPAEEMHAGKSLMAAAGAFDHLDACFMAHPSTENAATVHSNALKSFTATFRGRAAHAAASPEAGINALDAAVLFYSSLNAMRQHLREDARVHAIITKGGTSHTVIPALAEVRAGVRSNDEAYLDELVKRIAAAGRSAAKAIGARASIRWDRHGYRAFRLNPALEGVLKESYAAAGIRLRDVVDPTRRGSLDMANVSQIVPAGHPFFSIVPKGAAKAALHTPDFRRLANAPHAYSQAVKAGTGMAIAAARLLTEGQVLKAVKRDFTSARP